MRWRRLGGFVPWVALGCASAGSSAAVKVNAPAAPAPAASAPAPAAVDADPEAAAKVALARWLATDRERLRACYSTQLAQDPDLEDKMAVIVYVTAAGKVADMHLVAAEDREKHSQPSPLLSDAMAQCLGVPVMQWVFPPTKDWHGIVQVPWRPLFVAKWETPLTAEQRKQQRAAVIAEVKRHSGEMQKCYEAYLERAPRKKWKVRLMTEFQVTNAGSVEHPKVVERSTEDGRLEGCVLDVVRTMTFPAHQQRDVLIISYPFVFQPSR